MICRARKHPSYDGAVFHAQQSAEKYLNARIEEGASPSTLNRSHNQPRLVKGKRALLESNSPGIANWKLIETMSKRRQRWLSPLRRSSYIGSR